MSISLWQELLVCALLLLVPLYFFFKSSRSKNPIELPTNWPIVHMFPSVLANLNNMYEYLTVVLAGVGHNFRVYGPSGTGMRLFVTCDPANVQYIYTKNHANFPKGEEFAAIFDIMEGSFFTVDGEPWRRERAKIQSVLGSPRLIASAAACCRDKVENGLLPLLTNMASTGNSFDMQEMITRFMFDLNTTMVLGVNPGLLSPDMPPMHVATAMDKVMEVALYRGMMPAPCWKVMRWLNIGAERKLNEAQTVLEGFVTEVITERRKIKGGSVRDDVGGVEDILSSYIDDSDYDDNLLCAVLINSMLAGRDLLRVTLLWLLYSLAQNPDIMSTIRNELSNIVSRKVAGGMCANAMVIFEPEETKSLVYLRAAMYETLRLYPAGPFERKTVEADDILPSGHEVHANDAIIISLHSMARMEGVWGKDCLDYNPNRWLLEDKNKLRYIPSHKFLAFGSGPRMCVGKELAVMQMKTIVAAVVWNFDVEVVEGQSIQPKLSTILEMENGLVVKLKKRDM